MTEARQQILIVEEEAPIRNRLRELLEAQQYRVVESQTVVRAKIEVRSHRPDLLLIDPGLQDGDGVELLRTLRRWSPVPVIVLSAQTLERQKIATLDAGADDYVTKPFSTLELLARIRALLRRHARNIAHPHLLRVGDVLMDLANRSAHSSRGRVHFTPLEYRLLECLSRHAGIVVRRERLLCEVWGPYRLCDTRRLRACIKNLRAKLEGNPSHPKYLLTTAGFGYRLQPDGLVRERTCSDSTPRTPALAFAAVHAPRYSP